VKALTYQSGERVQVGDVVTYHGEAGVVMFISIDKTGDAAMDWYLDQWPDGGFMIDAEQFGNVFITDPSEEDLVLISRKGE
jgi:hypothetical protein